MEHQLKTRKKRVRLSETPCKWHYEDGIRFLVPGCWNRVLNDDAECHCYAVYNAENTTFEDDLVSRVEALEKLVLDLMHPTPAVMENESNG